MEKHVCRARECIEDRIAHRKLEGYESQRIKVRNTILDTITLGKSSFVLLVGQHGVGKDKMVKGILNEISAEFKGQYKKIKMNGYLHENDEVALKHITKKLHSDELIEGVFVDSLDDHIKHVINTLKDGDKSSKPLIFVLQEFHAFCEHGRQLIYNLLDVVNLEKAPMCIIGTTANNTCYKRLPQRTVSRTAHHVLILESKIHSKERLNLFRSLLMLEKESKMPKSFRDEWNHRVDQLFLDSDVVRIVEEAIKNQSEELFTFFMVCCIRCINAEHIALTANDFKNVTQRMGHRIDISGHIRNLTIVEHCLLIAICHVVCDERTVRHYGPKSFNFESVYSKFKTVADRWTQPRVSRSVAQHAFNKLKRQGFIVLENDVESDTPDFEPCLLTVPEFLVKDAIADAPHTTSEMRQWIGNSLLLQ